MPENKTSVESGNDKYKQAALKERERSNRFFNLGIRYIPREDVYVATMYPEPHYPPLVFLSGMDANLVTDEEFTAVVDSLNKGEKINGKIKLIDNPRILQKTKDGGWSYRRPSWDTGPTWAKIDKPLKEWLEDGKF